MAGSPGSVADAEAAACTSFYLFSGSRESDVAHNAIGFDTPILELMSGSRSLP
jgi:hypothetical protein